MLVPVVTLNVINVVPALQSIWFYCKSLQEAGGRPWVDPGFGELEFWDMIGDAGPAFAGSTPETVQNNN